MRRGRGKSRGRDNQRKRREVVKVRKQIQTRMEGKSISSMNELG